MVQPLRSGRDVRRALREGRRVHGGAAVLHARRRGAQEGPGGAARLAVIAGRRVGNAVSRNRARRVLREACRVLLAEGEALWDLVLVARPEVLELPHSVRVERVKALLGEAGVLGEKGASAG